MRTAEEIVESNIRNKNSKENPFSIDPFQVFEKMKSISISAINEARKEVIEEIYERSLTGRFGMDKQSFSELIKELQ